MTCTGQCFKVLLGFIYLICGVDLKHTFNVCSLHAKPMNLLVPCYSRYGIVFCQILMNVKSSLHAIKMLNAPTHLGPSLVPATMDTKEMDGLVMVSLSCHHTCCMYRFAPLCSK